MKIWVANCSLQIHEFIYRISEQNRERRLTIQPMSQTRLADEFSVEQLEALLSQNEKYGFVSVTDVKNGRVSKKFTRLCYSVDAPVSGVMIEALTMQNKSALLDFGKDLRKETAIASNAAIAKVLEVEQQKTGLEANFQSFEQTVQEEEPADGYNKPTAEIIGEGFHVEQEATAPPPQAGRQRRRG